MKQNGFTLIELNRSSNMVTLIATKLLIFQYQ